MDRRTARLAEVVVAFLIAGIFNAAAGSPLLSTALLILGAWRLTDFVMGELLRFTPLTNRSKNDE